MAANPSFSDVTYAGELFDEVFGPTVLNPAELIDLGLVTAMDQTKFKMTFNEFDDTVVLQNPSATFSDQGTQANIGEVNITTIPYEFHKQLEWSTIRNTWLSQRLRPGSLEDYDPSQLTDDFVREIYIPKLKLAQAHLVVRGKAGLDASVGSYTFSSGYSGLYEQFNTSTTINKLAITKWQITIATVVKGVTTVLVAAGDYSETIYPGNKISVRSAAGTGWTALNTDLRVLAVEYDGTTNTNITVEIDTDALTSANYTTGSARLRFINRTNIVEVMSNHMTLVPEQVWRNGNGANIVIPNHLFLEWQFANADRQQNGGGYYLTAYQMEMIGKQIVILDNAPDNTMGTWEAKRVAYAYDLADDYSNVEVLWQGQTGDKVYNLRGAMKTGISITKKFANEITLTTPDA